MSLMGLLAMGLLASCKPEEEKPYVPIEPELQEDYTETAFGMNLEMVYVKGGTFKMGATAEQGKDAKADEKPVRTIKLDSYHIGMYEVTQAQWKDVMGQDAIYDYDRGKGDTYPVYYVNWIDAQEFCQKLSEATGKKYILPTEAMWEYAARGGIHKTNTKYAGSNDIEEVAWYRGNSGNYGIDPDYGNHPVGTKKANALGIYDMCGNVWEWCSNWYRADEYNKIDDYNPQGPASGSKRVLRGGSWGFDAEGCRVSNRDYDDPDLHNLTVGFRVAVLL